MNGQYNPEMRNSGGIGVPGAAGFTLVELMIVVAIIAILAAVAIPSYNQHVIKTKRTDGTGELERMRGLMERYYFDANTYTVALSDLPALSTDTVDSQEKHYKISVKAATGTCPVSSCYELQAVPQGGQLSDGTLTLSSTGSKSRNGNAGWD